jgi:DNA helicase-4
LQEAGYTTRLAVLVAALLAHFKSNQMSLAKLVRKAKRSAQAARNTAFVELFGFFLEKYQSALDSKNPREIDFNDMISSATQYVKDGRFDVPWKYIIVDEFQDISAGRYFLLEAMLKSRADLQFFAVGDDWQSIYRFAGSDISIMSRFRRFFGRATIVKLDRTFRFNDRIAAVSGAFIQKNRQQIRKTLKTQVRCASPQVFLHWVDCHGDSRGADIATLEGVVHELKEQLRREDPSLLILARYNHLLPDQAGLNALANEWPGQIMSPMTVHRAKGLEADYVIVTGLTAERYGFPSEIEDDPLLNLVLAKPERYAHAEERRLFYVALTRARHQVHLLVDRTNPSSFALELLNGGYDVKNIGRSADDGNLCPECRSGLVEEKRPGYAACSNFPYCAFTAPKCSSCGKGFMLAAKAGSQRQYHCTSERCRGTAALCPQCRIGALVQKRGKYGEMLACHIWPRCGHIENPQQKHKERKHRAG